MALKDMALTAEEAKAQYGGCEPCEGGEEDKGPKYPWGLSVCIGTEAMAKLGVGLLPVGSQVMVTAMATVTGVSSRERQGGEPSQDMDLQITSMDLRGMREDPMDRAASRMYPRGDGEGDI